MTDTAPDTAETMIDGAIDVLRDGGWTRKAYENMRGEHCIVGALAVAAQRDHRLQDGDAVWMGDGWESYSTYGHAYVCLNEACQDRYPAEYKIAGYPGPETYNDSVFKSIDDAIEILEKGRAKAAEKGV